MHVNKGKAAQARNFLDELRLKVTTAELWDSSKTKSLPAAAVSASRPDVAVNVAFTFMGLLALGVPVRTLRGLPDEFQEGMLKRAEILRDDPFGKERVSAKWDPIWINEVNDANAEVHILVTLNASNRSEKSASPEEILDKAREALDKEFAWLQSRCGDDKALRILGGHRGPNPLYQEMEALVELDPAGGERFSRREHFGFTDGIGDPVFEGQYADPKVEAQRVVGQAKRTGDQTWVPLATGEFLLGYPDEAQEIPGTAMPLDFSRNGTFMAYRKLHQNVKSFHEYIAATAKTYASVNNISEEEANETLRAKMAGRWSDGVPLMVAPSFKEWQAFRERMAKAEQTKNQAEQEAIQRAFVDFTYYSDPDGSKCPFSSHLRRSNPRDMLDPDIPPNPSPEQAAKTSSVLNNRRRLLRRGLPYGGTKPLDSNEADQGVSLHLICSNLFRQFEFIQQQWMEYGLDFNAGNDTCPIIGNHGPQAKFVIASSAASGKPPFICDRPPQFVETRGGAYFFIPSMTALRLITQGLTDPT